MVCNIVLPLVLLTALYGTAIAGWFWLFCCARIPARLAIFLAFVGFGIGSAWLAAWIWPLDSSVYANVWAVLLGDWLYELSSELLGDPWLLQLPQVYGVAATLLYGGLGLLAQGIYRRHQARQGERIAGGNSMDVRARPGQ